MRMAFLLIKGNNRRDGGDEEIGEELRPAQLM